MKLKQYEFWGFILLAAILMICITFIVVGILGHFTIGFEMDNNTLEAIKSINWSAIVNQTR